MLPRTATNDDRHSQEHPPGGGTLSRRNSITSFFTVQSAYGENEPGHFVVVYDTLEKRISLESSESMKSSLNTICDLPSTNEK